MTSLAADVHRAYPLYPSPRVKSRLATLAAGSAAGLLLAAASLWTIDTMVASAIRGLTVVLGA